MGMRNVVREARLEHAKPAPGANGAVRIGQGDEADAVLPPAAEPAGKKRRCKRAREKDQHIRAVVEQARILRRRADMLRRQVFSLPDRVLGGLKGLSAPLRVAEQGERWQQHSERQQQVFHPGEPGLEAEPEVDADAAVNRDDEQQRRLQKTGERGPHEELRQLLRVALLGAEQAEGDASAEDMIGQKEGYAEPERELGRLHPGPAELPPLVERPEAEAHMGQERPDSRIAPGADCQTAFCSASPLSIAATEIFPNAWLV